MKKLSYKTLEEMNYDGYLLKDAPERVLQFGEGNFLRAFVDYFIDRMNEEAGFNSKVCVVQPIAFDARQRFKDQDALYTLYLRGQENGEKVNKKRIISALSRVINAYLDYDAYMACAENPDLRFIASNTTEAGIVYDPECKFEDKPANSFPGKLTQFLYKRFNLGLKGFIILSCELIDHNGDELKRCVHEYVRQWGLGDEFDAWVDSENIFCSTLVDRIVPGYPRADAEQLWAELGYEDNNLDTGEVFGAWVIEGPQSIKEEFPFEKVGLPIMVVDDVTPYKQRKVRILNGAHTSFVLASYLKGNDFVNQSMQDPIMQDFMMKTIHEEVIPTLTLPKADLEEFANAVVDRFNNPFIQHSLLAIALNSVSKWKARCLPSFLGYVEKFGKLPEHLTFSIASLMAFYSATELTDGALKGHRGDDVYDIKDDAAVLEFFRDNSAKETGEFVHAYLSNEAFHGQDLTKIEGLEAKVTEYLGAIRSEGMEKALVKYFG